MIHSPSTETRDPMSLLITLFLVTLFTPCIFHVSSCLSRLDYYLDSIIDELISIRDVFFKRLVTYIRVV